MSLGVYYSQTPTRTPVNTLILAHFDSHGTSYASARARVLRARGESVAMAIKFPETGPQGLSSGSIKNLIASYAPQRYEIIDIPVDVRNPDAAVKTLAELAAQAPVYYYDHHETDLGFVPRLLAAGVVPMVFGDNVAMATALELLSDPVARELAIVGMVADRDSAVLKLVPKGEVESRYLPLANRLDVAVRQPQAAGAASLAELAERLAERGVEAIPQSLEYPPERLAREISGKVIAEGSITVLVDWSDMQPQDAMWLPKTLEQLLLLRGKKLAIAVAPGYNPRTRALEGWDVRFLRYWLADCGVPVPEEVAREYLQRAAIRGAVVGHADYVSIRFPSRQDALAAAKELYRRVEGITPSATHLVNDRYVAEAVRRDYQAIMDKLNEILERCANTG